MKILEMNHIRKSFGDLNVLSDISLSVQEGQVVSIIGPSCSGKSTLLRCATLLETMDGGDLIYLGKYAAKDQGGKAVYASPRELKEIQLSADSILPVGSPVVVVSERVKSVKDGILADVAPTVLSLMGLPQPAEMTGKSLVELK